MEAGPGCKIRWHLLDTDVVPGWFTGGGRRRCQASHGDQEQEEAKGQADAWTGWLASSGTAAGHLQASASQSTGQA